MLKLLSEPFLILRIQRHIIKKVQTSPLKLLVIRVRFLMKTNFSLPIFDKKIPAESIFMKIRPVGAELLHACGRTDGQAWRSKESLFAIIAKVSKKPHLKLRNSGKWAGVAQSVYRLPKEWTVRRSNPGGAEIIRTCTDRPWGPPSLLYNGYWVFPGGKERPGRDADPSPPSSAVVMKG